MHHAKKKKYIRILKDKMYLILTAIAFLVIPSITLLIIEIFTNYPKYFGFTKGVTSHPLELLKNGEMIEVRTSYNTATALFLFFFTTVLLNFLYFLKQKFSKNPPENINNKLKLGIFWSFFTFILVLLSLKIGNNLDVIFLTKEGITSTAMTDQKIPWKDVNSIILGRESYYKYHSRVSRNHIYFLETPNRYILLYKSPNDVSYSLKRIFTSTQAAQERECSEQLKKELVYLNSTFRCDTVLIFNEKMKATLKVE